MNQNTNKSKSSNDKVATNKQQPSPPVPSETKQQSTPSVVDSTVAKSITQSDPIVSSVVGGVLNEGGDDSPIINQFNLEAQLQQQQLQQNHQLKQQQQQNPLISSLNLDNANILMLQQQLKLKQQQYQQQLSEENISAALQSKQFSDLAALTNQNSAVDPILLAAAAAASNPNSILLNKLANANPQMALDNLHTLQQQLSSSQQQQQQQNMDPKRGAVHIDHPDADKWFYLDPQNQIQGSFSSEQMAGWFAAGYFTLNLMIKRGCDEKFLPLGKFIMEDKN